jgi:PHD/YefM family antitoxin component YafN of YafNO toxin-antitoxin module
MKQVEVAPTLKWEEILQQLKNEDVVLTHAGHAVALVSDFDDDDLEWYEREHDPAFLESISRARAQVAEGKTVKHDDLKRQFGIE